VLESIKRFISGMQYVSFDFTYIFTVKCLESFFC